MKNFTNALSIEARLTEKTLLDLAGKMIYGRGLDYYERGFVSDLRMFNNKLRATVSGSDDYGVMLWADAHGLDYLCSCPIGDGGECCKHVVATGLAWLAQYGGRKNKSGAEEIRADTRSLRDYLLTQSRETLADWLLEQCGDDAALHAELKARAARGGSRRRFPRS